MKQQNIDYIKCISIKITTFFPFVSPFVADFIACQSALETAYGRSVVYQENHNAFGMKFPTKRLTTAVSESRNHANYYNVDDSIIDYFLWCSYNCMSKLDFINLTEFISHFKFSKYCPDPSYLEKINLIYNSFKSSQNEQTN